jgi:hypothetical protein
MIREKHGDSMLPWSIWPGWRPMLRCKLGKQSVDTTRVAVKGERG